MADEIYTMGVWQVKQGKEDAFASEWKEFAARSMRDMESIADARLLRDIKKQNRFASFGPWKSTEEIEKWRETPGFKKFMERAKEMCEEARIGTFEVVARVKK